MYKMIVIDLDGTLLNDEKEVSKENADMINRAYKEKGVISVIATGRSYMCAEHIANIVGESFSQYIIASTGSIIRDNKNGIDLNKQCIKNENIVKILEIAEKHNFKYIIDIKSKVIANGRLVNQEKLEKMGQSYEVREDLISYFKNNNIHGITITIIGKEQELLELKEELSVMEDLEITDLCKSIDVKEDKIKEVVSYIDIISKGVTKQNAIKTLANYLNINKDEIIVIGDGGNDIPMFETAGLKVAMANSIEIVKQKADYITSNNNENGVAKAIKKFIFNEKI